MSRFPTRAGYLHVRLPWTAFRSEAASSGKAEAAAPATLDPEQISYIGLRYVCVDGASTPLGDRDALSFLSPAFFPHPGMSSGAQLEWSLPARHAGSPRQMRWRR